MKGLRTVLSLLLLSGLLVAGAASTDPPPRAEQLRPAATTVRATVENRVIDLTNVRRAARGCAPVRYRWALVKAARGHSRQMAERRMLSHRLPGEPSLGRRVTLAGYTGWTMVAENIAVGYWHPWKVVRAWMNSAPHRRAMLNCGLRHVGVGLVNRNGERWWTMDLGRK